MQSHAAGERVKMNEHKNETRWIHCPICGRKTRARVYQDTVLVKFPLFCSTCKKETRINVVQMKMVVSDEPDV